MDCTHRPRPRLSSAAETHPSRCDAHHIHEYSAGGVTDIDNLELDCHGDHALIHQHGFDPRRTPTNPRGGLMIMSYPLIIF